MGYNASVYTWEDWKAHEAAGEKAGAAALAGGNAAARNTQSLAVLDPEILSNGGRS